MAYSDSMKTIFKYLLIGAIMSTIFLFAFTHIVAFVAGAFAHRWLAKEAIKPVAAVTSVLNDAAKQ